MISLPDIDQLVKTQNEGIGVELMHPVTGKGIGLRLWVVSYESQRVRAVQKAQRTMEIASFRNGENMTQSLEDSEIAIIVASVVGWSGDLVDGKEEFSTEAFRKFITDYPVFIEQIDEVAAQRRAFFRVGTADANGSAKKASEAQKANR